MYVHIAQDTSPEPLTRAKALPASCELSARLVLSSLVKALSSQPSLPRLGLAEHGRVFLLGHGRIKGHRDCIYLDA